MTKVSDYLQGHIKGEVSTSKGDLSLAGKDSGVLNIEPEIVIHPRNTNDIRKVIRFVWQLAKKDHFLPIFTRGGGTDTSGATIGKGIILDTSTHLGNVYEYDPKQLLVRVQAGTSQNTITQALHLQGSEIGLLRSSSAHSTIGGAIASATSGAYNSSLTPLATASQLEIALANGDLLQTERISSRELNRRKGLEGFVGDIYRNIDRIIDEYSDVIAKIRSGDFTGYNSIVNVKQKDGSFDLTPLFVGSQGTLGVITEMILKVQVKLPYKSSAILVASSLESARDAIDQVNSLSPQLLNLVSYDIFARAIRRGREFKFLERSDDPKYIIAAAFESDSEKHVKKQLKKLEKQLAKNTGIELLTSENSEIDLNTIDNLSYYSETPAEDGTRSLGIYSGFHIPLTSLEAFLRDIEALGAKELTPLPIIGHIATGIYSLYPGLSLAKVGDKQKIFKLVDKLTELISLHQGIFVAEGGEGRVKYHAIADKLDPRIVEMHEAVRKTFDPNNTFGPGIKQINTTKDLIANLQKS